MRMEDFSPIEIPIEGILDKKIETMQIYNSQTRAKEITAIREYCQRLGWKERLWVVKKFEEH